MVDFMHGWMVDGWMCFFFVLFVFDDTPICCFICYVWFYVDISFKWRYSICFCLGA